MTLPTTPQELCALGLVQGLDIDEYHAAPGFSKTQLDRAAESFQRFTTPIEKSPSLAWGKAYHKAVLEPEAFTEDDYVAIAKTPATRIKYAEAICDMRDALYRHEVARALLMSAELIEYSAWWVEPHTGALCKFRPDFITSTGIAVDLKSAKDASPKGFAKAVANHRYHVQAAIYSDGLEAQNVPPEGFCFIAQEKTPPYQVGVYQLDYEALEIGRELYRRNLEVAQNYAMRLRRGADPRAVGYSEKIETLSLPRWAVSGAGV